MCANTIKPIDHKLKTKQRPPKKLIAHGENTLANKHGIKLPDRSLQEAMHDLEVYQIELEMQNEELRRAQLAIEESRDRYIDFYDFAPVGYITLGNDGNLNEINLTGAMMLGEERNKLSNKNFEKYVAPEFRDRWRQHLSAALQEEKKLTCELALLKKNKPNLQVQLDSLRLVKDGKSPVIRIAMTDISRQ